MAAGVDYCRLVKTIHEGFYLATLVNLMKDWPGGSYLVMNSNPRVTGGIPIMAIWYKYSSRKVLAFIATEGAGCTEPGDPYLSCFPDIYSNVYVCPVFIPRFIGRYFNACNSIENQNRMWQSDIALEKYWLTQIIYFRLSNTVALGVGITDGEILFFHGISEDSMEKKKSTIEYSNSTVYDCFNNPFTDNFGSTYLNLPPITIDDRPRQHKRSCYTPDLIPCAIYVSYEIL